MVFPKDHKFQKALRWASAYTALIYLSLYFLPFLSKFLEEHSLLEQTLNLSYVMTAIGLVLLFLLRYRIFHWKAYLFFFGLIWIFLFEVYNARYLVERFHFLEYGILFGLWFRVVRCRWKHMTAYGVTLWGCAMLAVLDEGIQYLLPNRHFEWRDVLLSVEGVLFGMATVIILMHYRRDKGRDERYLWLPR